MKKKGLFKKFSLRRLIKSFGYAFHGIRLMILQEQNARIHLFVTCCVVIAGCCFHLSAAEWVAVVIAIGSVIAAEAFNTSIEALSDMVSPQYSENIKQVKDFAAGAVLTVAGAAIIVGFIIFLPKIIALF
ncbi:MAG: diacylglycerol kinase family protein [Tannerella sp.]|jgi:diacylglycerol kinase (ATP)|nr:diacylglycerol kinase family protein [Tannerella sp.]